ncbi:Rnf-Nqr domain containing protein [Pseudomonas defluvii]|uniref:Rnf-Nqr domain containing protein n=1 Tax=unclassified Pseudomonas TaxID=196821 RepID=UPI000C199EC1|nr:Rnf-Nqr domain containing protein [Pseudomonas sp. HLS-6]ATR84473.1 NADH:quinone oxidoreductase [Pseudomonas sp. HLS-6]MEE3635469.1 Rnf-Nqr domain containing protein [Pseudomonas sp. AL 58]WJM96468.1 Rnf-Nqr domain containing protein [Pseudomonas defluvii]
MTELIVTLIGAALINNIVLHQGLALDPALRIDGAADRHKIHALGLTTGLLMLSSTLIGQLLYRYLLLPLQLDYLRLFVFLPLCIVLITPLLTLVSRWQPQLPQTGLKPLLLGNAGVLALSLTASSPELDVLQVIALSIGSGLGFWLVLILLDDLRQRTLDNDAIPESFRGLPLELIGAGIMAMAFLGLNGLFTS